MKEVHNKIIIAVSSRALFDLEEENRIFEEEGRDAYAIYQDEHEDVILKPGIAFPLVKALEKLNDVGNTKIDILLVSRNEADTSLRIFNSIKHYNLNIERAALIGEGSMIEYLKAFQTDLFLSAYEEDVQDAIDADIAAGIICGCSKLQILPEEPLDEIRIAFDGDAVIFSDESERIYKAEGVEAFNRHEQENARVPLPEGPFAKILKLISDIQKEFPRNEAPIKTALVTSRSIQANERVIRTFRAWGVRVDESFFLGGVHKRDILKAFGANIFFDDQKVHTDLASEKVPTARVLYKNICN